MTYLLDSNILVYAADDREPERMDRANELLQHVAQSRKAVISAQVLAEFATVSLRKVRGSSAIENVYRQIEAYARTLIVLPVTKAVILEAVRGVRTSSSPITTRKSGPRPG